uniref:Uncharacterized protein n=1 Tax=Oryza punctata TaxID=4537 RepID=A0A0E0M9Z4_ORYPU
MERKASLPSSPLFDVAPDNRARVQHEDTACHGYGVIATLLGFETLAGMASTLTLRVRCRKLAARLGCRAVDVVEPQVHRSARTTGESSRNPRGHRAADEEDEQGGEDDTDEEEVQGDEDDDEEEQDDVEEDEQEDEEDEEADEIGPSQLHDAPQPSQPNRPQPSQANRPRRAVKQPDRFTLGQGAKRIIRDQT